MNENVKVLHLTAHMGGGVGKALSGLVTQAVRSESKFRHTIVCLEQPDKMQFIRQVESTGGKVVVCPNRKLLCQLVTESDIVQIEWWNHPATISRLCRGPLPSMRLVVWCHVSGLHLPRIPSGLIRSASRFMFTSPCSFEDAEVAAAFRSRPERFSVVHSCGGFDGLPTPAKNSVRPNLAGYIGSLNFAKLHPQFVDFLAAVKRPDFKVRVIGDTTNQAILEQQCRLAGRPELLDFRGYTEDIASELSAINVLAYILNPEHYGTSENALLEAMAMGIVPVVLGNPAERHIVEDGVTGLIVNSPSEFRAAVEWLFDHPQAVQTMGLQASKSVRRKFAVRKMYEALYENYTQTMNTSKHRISFTEIFGTIPADWFLVNQRHPEYFTSDQQLETIDTLTLPGLFEKTKGSVFHYYSHFPGDLRLQDWVTKLNHYEAYGVS